MNRISYSEYIMKTIILYSTYIRLVRIIKTLFTLLFYFDTILASFHMDCIYKEIAYVNLFFIWLM